MQRGQHHQYNNEQANGSSHDECEDDNASSCNDKHEHKH
jgi:hypothetical protein